MLLLFFINNPDSDIKTDREFRLALIEELVHPLLLAKASGQSALYQGARRPRKDFSHLKGLSTLRYKQEKGMSCMLKN